MRVAFFVDAFPSVTETFILNQITGLIDRGHEVDIFARGMDGDDCVHPDVRRYRLLDRTYYPEASGRKFERLFKALTLLSSPAWLRPSAITLLVRLVAKRGAIVPFNTFGLLLLASREQRRGRYDIVHCQYGTLGRAVLGVRRIGAIHGALVTSFRGHDISQHHTLQPGFYAELFREGELFLPVSRSLEERLVALGCPQEKIALLHSGIDLSAFRFRERTRDEGGTTIIITVARLVEMKGVAFGIEAVAKLLQAGHRIAYHIVGGGPLHASLRVLIQNLGVQEYVHVHGAKPHDDVLRLLDTAHLMLAPSVTAANGEVEGIPNALKEAMAMGLPVVATRHGGIPELVEDGLSGHLAAERDADALADQLSGLLVHPERWAAMGRAGRARIEAVFDRNALNDELVRRYALVTKSVMFVQS